MYLKFFQVKFNFLSNFKFLLHLQFFINNRLDECILRNSAPLSAQGTVEKYKECANEVFNSIAVQTTDFEFKMGYALDRGWLKDLGLVLGAPLKASLPSYDHGLVLYSCLRNYAAQVSDSSNPLTIVETGTARGFSALCMAKAFEDAGIQGKILTFDFLPHDKPRYWNCIADHTHGKLSRRELLSPWWALVEKYIIFCEGITKSIMPKIHVGRINFAFLDGAHTKEDIAFEIDFISQRQLRGDIVVFDDYNENKFPKLFSEINRFMERGDYKFSIIDVGQDRKYLIGTKVQ